MLGKPHLSQPFLLVVLVGVVSNHELKQFFSESLIMKDFNHPNVLGLLGVVFDTPDGVPYLVLPYMDNGSLKNYLKSSRVVASDVHSSAIKVHIKPVFIS
jgi:serine/threonine protein kinase